MDGRAEPPHMLPGSGHLELWLALALAGLMAGFFVGPRVPDDEQSANCVVNVRVASPFGVALNCDSPELLRLAREPSALLEPENSFQSRPGLILTAAILAIPLSPLASLPHTIGVRASPVDSAWSRIDDLAADFPPYVAYVLLNVGILLLSFHLCCRIGARAGARVEDMPTLGAICFLLAANDVVKAFGWSPHFQMFNILVPVWAFWTSLRAGEGALRDARFALATGVIAGVGATAYPLFAIVLPCVVVSGSVYAIRNWSRTIGWTHGRNLALLTGLMIVPESVWYVFVRHETGGFYERAMALGEVTWLAGAWQQGFHALWGAWWENVGRLLGLVAGQAVALAAVLVLLGAVAVRSWTGVAAWLRRLVPVLLTGILVAAVTLAFYATVGLIEPRLAYAVIPPLIVAAAVAASGAASGLHGLPRKVLVHGSVLVAVAQAVFEIAKNGPFS
jgi:hypothetical protein